MISKMMIYYSYQAGLGLGVPLVFVHALGRNGWLQGVKNAVVVLLVVVALE